MQDKRSRLPTTAVIANRRRGNLPVQCAVMKRSTRRFPRPKGPRNDRFRKLLGKLEFDELINNLNFDIHRLWRCNKYC